MGLCKSGGGCMMFSTRRDKEMLDEVERNESDLGHLI